MNNIISLTGAKHSGKLRLAFDLARNSAVGFVKPFTDRVTCFMKINEEGFQIKKPIHILGCNNPVEISFFTNFPLIKSIDSCIAYLYKDQEIPLDNSINKRIDTPHEFFDWKLTDSEIEQSWKNIDKIDRLCGY